MATHSSIPAWEIPWTEEPGRLQSMASLMTECTHTTGSLHTQGHYTHILPMLLLSFFLGDVCPTGHIPSSLLMQ